MEQKKEGNGEAIASSILKMAGLKVPIISIVIGEDVLEKAYFQNDYKLLLDNVKKVGIELAGKNGFMNWNSLANYYSNRGE